MTKKLKESKDKETKECGCTIHGNCNCEDMKPENYFDWRAYEKLEKELWERKEIN